MKEISEKFGVIQNLGWLDRVVRTVAGVSVLAFALNALSMNADNVTWAFYLVLLSVYPLLTGMIGWDPIYQSVTVRSCGTSDRNPCGTFPFEVDAALGHQPIPSSPVDHSLENSRHAKH